MTALAVLCATLGISIGAWNSQRRSEMLEASIAFSREASQASSLIRERLDDYDQVLRGGKGFFAAHPDAHRGDWHRYTHPLELARHYPGLFILAYAPRVRRGELPAFIRRMRDKEGLSAFNVYPLAERQEFVPVAYVEPDTSAHGIYGFDLSSEATRQAALIQARETGEAALSGPIAPTEAQGPGQQISFLMVTPTYQEQLPLNSTAQRNDALTGYVFTVFHVQKFINSIQLAANDQLTLEILDQTAPDTPPLRLYDSHDGSAPGPWGLLEEREIRFGGRSWLLRFTDRPAFARQLDTSGSWAVLSGGLVISLLLSLLTLHLGSRRHRAENIARRQTRELAIANAKLKSVLDAMPDLLFEVDQNLRIIGYHAQDDRELMLPPGAFLGKTVPEIMPPALGQRMSEAFAAAHHQGTQFLEYQLPQQNGVVSDYEARITPINGSGYLAVIRNITDRKAMEQALLTANQRMQAVFDSATEVAIIATDTQGIITIFNRGAERMLGYSAAEVIGKCTPAMLHLPEEMERRGAELSTQFGWVVSGFDVFVTNARLAGVEEWEWTYVRKDGKHLTVDLVITAVHDEADNVIGFLGVAVNISARKETEEELRRHRDHLQELVTEHSADLLLAKEAAERANMAKSEFLANMSHELRTPMHAILSFAGLGYSRAQGLTGAEKLQHYFVRIKESGERLLALVNDLLDLSRLEAGKMPFDPRPQDLLPLVREALAEMEPLLADKQLHMDITADSPTVALCDPLRLGQLIRNLISNAIKFSPNGGTIRIHFCPALLHSGRRAADNGHRAALQMTVQDEGIGIPPHELEQVFDKFVQSSKTKTGAGGTGLGLAICREIAEAHRGSIYARCNDGPGASLVLVLPVPLSGSRSTFKEPPCPPAS
ncbi:MAG: CHASE domain-containing protein [Betaproteobacteria bacterium]|nr:CHASE domain-containing protein [Betaproteobacteria bacterium]